MILARFLILFLLFLPGFAITFLIGWRRSRGKPRFLKITFWSALVGGGSAAVVCAFAIAAYALFGGFLTMRFFIGPSLSYADYQLADAVDHRDAARAESALEKGADPNFLGLDNETQLMMASQNGDVQSAEALLKHGAKPDLMDVDGITALMIASRAYRPEMTRLLLEHGANPNIKSHDNDSAAMGETEGYTALMFACRSSSFEMVQVLLDHGADPHCVGADGRTALDIAKQKSGWRDREPAIALLERANQNNVY